MKAGSFNVGKLSDVAKLVPKNPSQLAEAKVAISLIDARPQVRTKFINLEELAESFKLNGIIEPLVLHAEDNGRYRLIVGERRLRAAPLAGFTEVPVVIKRGLTEFQIRALQVAENNDREDLSAYEQAMGAIEDVEKFGVKEAMKIWNCSEGWISKRVAVKKYGAITREILETGLSGDFEVLHCLNQLEGLDAKEFLHLKKRLEGGLPISRDEARNTLARVKDWKKQQDELGQRRKAVAAAREKSSSEAPASHASAIHAKSGHSPSLAPALTSTPAFTAEETAARAAVVAPGTSPEEASAAERKRTESNLRTMRDALFERGENNMAHFSSMQSKMTEMDYELNQGEWVLWAGFLDSVLPMLHALGSARSMQYLKRLEVDLKGKPALQIWRELHPVVDGKKPDDESAPRQRVPDMPKDWRF